MEIRQATISDVPFVLDAIIESEKSGTEILSWACILGATEDQVRSYIHDILIEEIEGQEWYIPNFRIVVLDGEPVAALSCWIEGETGLASSTLKAQAMAYMAADLWSAASKNLQLVASVQIARTKGALQLEHIYTVPSKRGQGFASLLIQHCIDASRQDNNSPHLAEIQLMGENEPALRSYTKCGFLKTTTGPISEIEAINLLPGRYRVSLTRKI